SEEGHTGESEIEQAPRGEHRLTARLPQPKERIDAERDEDDEKGALPPRIIRNQVTGQQARRETPLPAPGQRNHRDKDAEMSEQGERAREFHGRTRQVGIGGVAGKYGRGQAASERPLQPLPAGERDERCREREPGGARRTLALDPEREQENRR